MAGMKGSEKDEEDKTTEWASSPCHPQGTRESFYTSRCLERALRVAWYCTYPGR